jgi:hypothetical protein
LGITISDSSGEIYVCDPENRGTIKVISKDEESIKLFSMHHDPDDDGDDGDHYPSDIAFSSDEHM